MYRESMRTTTNRIPIPRIGDILAYFAARVSADIFPPMTRRIEKVRIMFSYIKMGLKNKISHRESEVGKIRTC